VTQLSKHLAKRFGLGKIYIPNWIIIARWQLRGERTRQIAHKSLPNSLRRLVLGHPIAVRQRHENLVFAWPSPRLIRRATHRKRARRTPAKINSHDLAFIACFGTIECGVNNRPVPHNFSRRRVVTVAAEEGRQEQRQ
jgi:hypothetical protein